MGIEDLRSTGLVLGLGFTSTVDHASPVVKTNDDNNDNYGINQKQRKYHHESSDMEPSLTLSLSGETYNNNNNNNNNNNKNKKFDMNMKVAGHACHEDNNYNNNNNNNQCEVYRQASSPHSHSAVSSFSSPRVKRERDLSSEEVEVEKVACSKVSDEDDDGVNARKKLRLTKDQSALLEESFKQHSTLNPKQKQALARQLNLRPRQVEVWFQNRRARTKLKQTEVDCEFLKKCCETLTDENRRLQKELQELKALKLAQPMYMHMPAATLTMCPSCERIGGVGDVVAGAAKTPFSVVTKPHFCNPFSNQSAAC